MINRQWHSEKTVVPRIGVVSSNHSRADLKCNGLSFFSKKFVFVQHRKLRMDTPNKEFVTQRKKQIMSKFLLDLSLTENQSITSRSSNNL